MYIINSFTMEFVGPCAPFGLGIFIVVCGTVYEKVKESQPSAFFSFFPFRKPTGSAGPTVTLNSNFMFIRIK